jgi:cell division transport system permease protein
MSFLFSINEGFKGFFKARLATTLSVSSIALTIFLTGLFVVFTINLQSWLGFLREKIEVELFIETGSTDKEIDELKNKIKKLEAVREIEYISKDDAAQRFQEEFGQNIYEVLEFNPFPSSIVIHLNEGYLTPAAISKLKNRLELMTNVDDVFYKKPLLEKIDKYVQIVYVMAILIGLVIIIIAIGLIFNTIRLTIYARKDMIHIMRLIGATEGFIRKPFLVEGILQGFLGGILASLAIYYSMKLIQIYIYPYIISHPLVFVGLILFSMIIGLFSAYLSVGKYIRII